MFSTGSANTAFRSQGNMNAFNDTGVYSLSVSLTDTKPSGQVFKLDIPAVEESHDAAFGTHIQEAVEIVRDWNKGR